MSDVTKITVERIPGGNIRSVSYDQEGIVRDVFEQVSQHDDLNEAAARLFIVATSLEDEIRAEYGEKPCADCGEYTPESSLNEVDECHDCSAPQPPAEL